MNDLWNAIPDTAWIILAVAIAGLLLMIGARILRKGLLIKRGKLLVELDDESEHQEGIPKEDA